MKETLDASAEIWWTLHNLADIAGLQGWTEEVQIYRRREHETYAAFAGNRYHIDQKLGPFIVSIAAAAKGSEQSRTVIEKTLLELEASERGQQVAIAIRRIWKGERDWHTLAKDLDGDGALLVLRVLSPLAGLGRRLLHRCL